MALIENTSKENQKKNFVLCERRGRKFPRKLKFFPVRSEPRKNFWTKRATKIYSFFRSKISVGKLKFFVEAIRENFWTLRAKQAKKKSIFSEVENFPLKLKLFGERSEARKNWTLRAKREKKNPSFLSRKSPTSFVF